MPAPIDSMRLVVAVAHHLRDDHFRASSQQALPCRGIPQGEGGPIGWIEAQERPTPVHGFRLGFRLEICILLNQMTPYDSLWRGFKTNTQVPTRLQVVSSAARRTLNLQLFWLMPSIMGDWHSCKKRRGYLLVFDATNVY
jgi:hypothetical protein